MDVLVDNYVALMMCIFTGWEPEQCFNYLETLRRPKRKSNITEDDVLDMIRLKQNGMSHREIGEIYGLSPDAVYYRIKRSKKVEGSEWRGSDLSQAI